MAKEKNAARASSFLQDLFHIGVYKRNQGRVVRQVTFAALAVTMLLGFYQVYLLLDATDWTWLEAMLPSLSYWIPSAYWIPGGLILIGLWVSYRIVNYPQFADFLIAVEAEMNKVSWPSRTELIRSSLVVIFMMFFLAIILFGFDLVWRWLFQLIGVIQQSPNDLP